MGAPHLHMAGIHAELELLIAENPGLSIDTARFDIERLDFSGVRDPDGVRTALGRYQRMLQVARDDHRVASALSSAGFTSAHEIAACDEGALQSRLAPSIDDGDVKTVLRRARDIVAAAEHLCANIRDRVASPAMRAMPVVADDPSLVDVVTQIPGYAELFGSLDYLECDDCRSVLSPGAYYVDLMRLTTEKIIGSSTVPPAYQLKARRPDLYTLPLTCDNTNTTAPYTHFVVNVLCNAVAPLASVPRDAAIEQLATAPYPMSAPFREPLERIRGGAAIAGSSYAEILGALNAAANSHGVQARNVSAERLDLSIEATAIVTTPCTTLASLSAMYGMDVAQSLPHGVNVPVRGAANSSVITSAGPSMTVLPGDAITVGAQSATVVTTANNCSLATVTPAWKTAFDVAQFSVAPSGGIADVHTFCRQTEITRDDLVDLLTEGLSTAEIAAGASSGLFINAGDQLPPLALALCTMVDPDQPFEHIVNLSAIRLDRINRLLRLCKRSGHTPLEIDTALGIAKAADLTPDFLVDLDKLASLARAANGDIATVAPLFVDLPTLRGVFDGIFNPPALLNGKTPSLTVPFSSDPHQAIPWDPSATDDLSRSIVLRLAAALQLGNADVARFVTAINPKATPLTLTVAALSQLYRLALASRLLQLSPTDVLRLMTLCDLQPAPGAAWTVGGFALLADYARVLRSAGIGVQNVAFALGQPTDIPIALPYTLDNVRATINQTVSANPSVFLAPAMLVGGALDAVGAKSAFDALIEQQLLTPEGAFTAPANATPLDFNTASRLIPLQAQGFAGNVVSQADANVAYAYLCAHPVSTPILQTLTDTTAALTSAFTGTNDLSGMFPSSDPNSAQKIAHVVAVLNLAASTIAQMQATTQAIASRQYQLALQTAASLLGSTQSNVLATTPFGRDVVGAGFSWQATMLTAIPGNVQIPRGLIAWLGAMARGLTLSQLCSLSLAQTQFVFAQSAQSLHGTTPAKFRLVHVLDILDLRNQMQAFGDTAGALLQFYAMPAPQQLSAQSEQVGALAAVTQWAPAQIIALLGYFWPGDGGADELMTIDGVNALNAVFDVARRVGNSVADVSALALLSVQNPPYAQWSIAADRFLAGIRARMGSQTFDGALSAFTSRLLEDERDVLVPYARTYVNANVKLNDPLLTTADLYGYFLIDTQMESVVATSPLVQAISTVQLYMQRARLNMEPGITIDPQKFHPSWWEWISNYRVWQANREIMLYPENYINPTLRTGTSFTFDAFSAQLLQTALTDGAVTSALMTYIDDLEDLSTLQHCAGYRWSTADSQTRDGEIGDDDVETTYLFARSLTAPFVYYYRSQTNNGVWTPWQRIDVKVSAGYISPVYAFDRLFIFWIENSQTKSSVVGGGGSSSITSTDLAAFQGQIRYSFLTAGGKWAPPQSLGDQELVEFQVNYDLTTDVKQAIAPVSVAIQTDNANSLNWQEVDVARIPASTDPALNPWSSEQILVNVGGGLPFSKSTPQANPGAIGGGGATMYNPTQKAFNAELAAYLTRYNAIVSSCVDAGGKGNNLAGVAQATPMVLLDRSLAPASTNVSFYQAQPELDPTPFAPVLDRTNGVLGLGDQQSVMSAQYYSDDTPVNPAVLPPAMTTKLLAKIASGNSSITTVKNQLGWFIFNNGVEAFLVRANDDKGLAPIRTLDAIIRSANGYLGLPASDAYLWCAPWTTVKPYPDYKNYQYSFLRLTTQAPRQLSDILTRTGLAGLFSSSSQRLAEPDFTKYEPQSKVIAPPANLDFKGTFAAYFWEIFFHCPLLVANRLNAAQRFEDAKRWFEYIFDPTAPPDASLTNPIDRVWRFIQLRSLPFDDLIDDLGDPAQVQAYNENPFDPDAIARLRTSAYAKAVVMAYVKNLIDWGDMLFSQYTTETIDEARTLYTLASQVLGERPVQLGRNPDPKPLTVADILARGDVPEFLINIENALAARVDVPRAREVPINRTSLYFCLPENAQLLGYWDTVADRLYKIRNGLNLSGVAQPVPLFAPPIDPNALIASARSGSLDVGSIYGAAVPEYRFTVSLERAKAFTSQVAELGRSLLAALEKRDAALLEVLRVTQEGTILNLTTYSKQQRIAQLVDQQAALEKNLANASARLSYYSQWINTGYIAAENLALSSMGSANTNAASAGAMKIIAQGLFLIPQEGSPFAMTYGGQQLGTAMMAVSEYYAMQSAQDAGTGQISAANAGYIRRAQEWQLQQTLAQNDVAEIQAQIQANIVEQNIAKAELQTHLATIANNNQLNAYYQSRFTNDDLYSWMSDQLSGMYYQAYQIAVDHARAAQSAYQFEMNSSQVFLSGGFWNDQRKGLLAAEQIAFALGQMEKAYLANNVRKREVVKIIPLSQLDPQALITLRSTGQCMFNLGEALFDADFPGHYQRTIKTISITMPAIVGPYQSINATLTQLSNQVVLGPDQNAVAYLLGRSSTAPPSTSLRSNWRSSQGIAVSRGLDDSGLFELDFRDERYLPFEGTGAVSTWQLSVPKGTNRLDLSALSDVVIKLQYEAVDSGQPFRDQVAKLLPVEEGFVYFNLARDFASSWYAFMHPAKPADSQQMTFPLDPSCIPANLAKPALTGLYLKLEAPAISVGASSSYITLGMGSFQQPFNPQAQSNDESLTLTKSVSMDDMLGGTAAFTVDVAHAPAEIKTKDGTALDPSALHSIHLVLAYSGTTQLSDAGGRS